MTSSHLHHPFRIDVPTLEHINVQGSPGKLLQSVQLPENVKFLSIDPAAFTHAYILLGQHPQRFASDLSLYLSTIKTFFERADVEGGISIPAASNADSRRRLSEDLGVGMASYFMTEAFGVDWVSISQIPQNSKLSKKRPDFQCYNGNSRFLFEAKGTTGLSKIEASLSKAIGQVKAYPEAANSKIAVVTYFSADERFFPSTSFVVDPPALPEPVPPDKETSRLLHFEKVLQFAGKADLAKIYVQDLSRRLRAKHREEMEGEKMLSYIEPRVIEFARREEPARAMPERKPEIIEIGGAGYEGQFLIESDKWSVFVGARSDVLAAGLNFQPPADPIKMTSDQADGRYTSVFDDGTLLMLKILR